MDLTACAVSAITDRAVVADIKPWPSAVGGNGAVGSRNPQPRADVLGYVQRYRIRAHEGWAEEAVEHQIRGGYVSDADSRVIYIAISVAVAAAAINGRPHVVQTADQRQQVSEWHSHNNDIQSLCACDPDKQPATYADIRALNANLEENLKEFCTNLFTKVIALNAVTSRIGKIDDHYDEFVSVNECKCPYCGYGDIKGINHTRREAYDHFLPKSIYPFNSVNFRNLAPMCHECNSSYKLQQDPIRQPGGTRRKAFYSYAEAPPGTTVRMTFDTKDIQHLKPNEIDMQLAAAGREEEVETWKAVFGIEERYKAKLCGKNDGIYWLQQICDEAKNLGLEPHEMLAARLKSAEANPYADANFLRMPFLIACQRANII